MFNHFHLTEWIKGIEMSDIKMSAWFKTPVTCMLQLNGDNYHESPDSITVNGMSVMTGHHVEKVEIAINSYDSNQELIESQAKEIELLRDALSDVTDGYDKYDLVGWTGFNEHRCEEIKSLALKSSE